jgi:hypothetical protein
MKNIIAIALFIICAECYAQDKLVFTEVVTVDSTLKKNDLFNSAREWLNKTFTSGKDVSQIVDKESGEISGKGFIEFVSKYFNCSARISGKIWFTVNIYLKDGKYKYEFSDFRHEGSSSMQYGPISLGLITNSSEYPYDDLLPITPRSWYTKRWIEIKDKINAVISLNIKDLKEVMAKKMNSNW